MSTSAQYIPGVAELGRKNQADGYVGINGGGVVVGTFSQRRDTAANIAAIVLANGELAFTSDREETFIGDGATAGGIFLSQKPQVASAVGVNTLAQFVGTMPDSGLTITVKSGATYKILAAVRFTGDTDNISNFKLSLYLGTTINILRATEIWGDVNPGASNLPILEQRALIYPGGRSLINAYPQTELTKSEMELRYEITLTVVSTGSLILAPNVRSGTTSPAKASASYEWSRIR